MGAGKVFADAAGFVVRGEPVHDELTPAVVEVRLIPVQVPRAGEDVFVHAGQGRVGIDVPFSDQRRVVPALAQQLGEDRVGQHFPDRSGLADVGQAACARAGVLPAEQARSRRRTQRHVRARHVEPDASSRQRIDVRRADKRVPVAAQLERPHLIAQAQDDVRSVCHLLSRSHRLSASPPPDISWSDVDNRPYDRPTRAAMEASIRSDSTTCPQPSLSPPRGVGLVRVPQTLRTTPITTPWMLTSST